MHSLCFAKLTLPTQFGTYIKKIHDSFTEWAMPDHASACAVQHAVTSPSDGVC